METVKACFFGLGVLGGQIAARLAESGVDVRGFDLKDDLVAAACAHGVKAGVPADLAQAQYVFTSLPSDEAVKGVLLGGGDVLNHLSKGTVIVELSTVLPATVVALDEAARARQVCVIDLPVSGGPKEAHNGQLKLLAGAREADLEKALPVLQLLGDVLHVGKVGDGKTVKLVNNMMTMGNVAVAAEAFTLGVRAGLDPQRLFDILSQSGGRSHHFIKRFPNLLKSNYAAGFSAANGEKDLRLAVALGHQTGVPTLLASLNHSLYEWVCQRGLASEDIIAIAKLFQGQADGLAADEKS